MGIYIDGNRADTDRDTTVGITLAVASLTDMDNGRNGYSKTITLPMTARNRAIMGDAEQINSASMFNRGEHTARIEHDGCVVMEGVPLLSSCESAADGGHYRLNIIGHGKQWANYAANTPLRKLPIDFSAVIDAATVCRSWTWDKPVRFLPVHRDRFDVENPSANLFPPVRALTFEDYHPFLHLRSLLDSIFSGAGYAIDSSFMDSDFFRSLYISGNYPKKNVEAVRALGDFRAGRFADAQAAADGHGRVYANPAQNLSSVGNIADTADPTETRGGAALENVYTNGGYFSKNGTRIMFAPPKEMTVGFEYHLFYTTDYYILSRDRLSGFDLVNLGDGLDREVSIANRNTDRRGEIRNNRSYMAIVFDYDESSSYELRYDEVTDSQGVTTRVHSAFNSRTQGVVFGGSNTVQNPQLFEKRAGAAQYTPCGSDWALYDGHVTERGTKEVELTIRSAPERILPSRPKYFYAISFGGAEPGMNFRLGRQTTVRPVFGEYPGEGSTVRFEDTAAHEMNCLELINALRHMFNLWFYTDHLARRVFIEPREGFWLDRPVVDWSDKADLSKPVTVSEPGAGAPAVMTLRYAAGDGAVSRWNSANQETFGKWSARIGNRFAREGETTTVNLFTPSINTSGSFPDAVAASLLQVGDREYSAQRSEDLNFPVKIVRYSGMTELPAGQHWGWPSGGGEYPLLAFHLPDTAAAGTIARQGFTLCFEDRDGMAGLHRHWDGNIRTLNGGRQVGVYVWLTAGDVEPFVSPDSLRRDFRARFRLRLDGETACYRLDRICDYNPAAARPTLCVFTKET